MQPPGQPFPLVVFACARYLDGMEFHEIEFGSQPPVDGYAPGAFRVADVLRDGPLLLGPDGLKPWQGFADTAPVMALSGKIDVLFVGTGADIAHPPASFRAEVEAAGIALEVMATPSACRTYNILLSEARRVAIAALPV